jgi:hypothetical protein
MPARKAGQKKPSGRARKEQPVADRRRTEPKAARPSRGPVDAPGKHHRKPPPQERVDRMMGEPEGKKMGHKSFLRGNPRARG